MSEPLLDSFVHDESRVAYHLAGDGPELLLIHGVGVVGASWRPQLEGLADGFRMAAPDLPGFGASELPHGRPSVEGWAEAARALMDHLGWERAHVAGHSMGGLVAQQLALAHPRRVRSLALLCTGPRGSELASISLANLPLAVGSFVGTRRMRRRAFMRMVLSPRAAREDDLDAWAERFVPIYGRDVASPAPRLRMQLGALKDFDRSAELGGITAPTLVVSASHDRIAPPARGRALAAAIPGARYEEVDGMGHALPVEHAAFVNGRLHAAFA